MAPKRSRTSTRCDTTKFVSLAASNRYETSLLKKVPIRERGFNLPTGAFCSLDHEFNRRGWGKFCKQPPAAILPMVREFYANAYEHHGSVAIVRGKAVASDRTMLNRFYGLEDIEYDEYSTYVDDLFVTPRLPIQKSTKQKSTKPYLQ